MLQNFIRDKNQILRLLCTGLIVLAGLQLARAFTALFSPIVIDYCEMTVAGAAEQWLQSGNLADSYAPPAAPYNMPGVQYPPLFIGLLAAIRGISGLPVITLERLLAWGLYVAAGVLVGLIVRQATGKFSLIAAALPFCFWSVIIFVHAARVDPLALFLSLLTAYLYRRKTALPLVALMAVLAFFSKQTYLAVSAAIFFDLLLSKGVSLKAANYKATLIFAGYWFGWAALGFGLFGWLSGGYFFGIFEPARAGSFIFHLVPGFIFFFVADHLPLIILALISLGRQWRQGERFLPLYTLFAALACVTIIKDGAVDYYFNELAYVLSISVGLLLARAPEKVSRLQLGLVAIQFVIACGMLVGWSHWKDFEANEAAYREGLALVRQAQQNNEPALVLVDSFLLETGQAQRVADYFIYSVLLTNRQRNVQPLLDDLNRGRYKLIITENFLRWPAVVEQTLRDRYNLRKIYSTDGRTPYWVYTLK